MKKSSFESYVMRQVCAPLSPEHVCLLRFPEESYFMEIKYLTISALNTHAGEFSEVQVKMQAMNEETHLSTSREKRPETWAMFPTDQINSLFLLRSVG